MDSFALEYMAILIMIKLEKWLKKKLKNPKEKLFRKKI
jgi:hypothetical protein